MFINHEYIKPARSLMYRAEFRERSELFIMTALYRLGTGASFRTCRALCNISTSEVHLFFDTFPHAMHEMRDITELRRVSKYYEESGLPGCCGSMDVVHVKWTSCPTGDHNRAKGKGGYPSLAFQCIADFIRRILAVYGPQFGTRNDKEIVKDDPNVHFVRTGWYKDVLWNYYTAEGRVEQDRGAYLICDNGYLRWPTSICPYAGCENSSLEGFFLTNLESVRKDVECTFGILKKRRQVLNDGLVYRDINKCEKIFNACCCQITNTRNFFGKSPKESQLLFIFPPETLRSMFFLRTLVHSVHFLTDQFFIHELIILNFINDRDILSKKSPLLDVLLLLDMYCVRSHSQ
jgi:hypothetical protein